MKQKQGTRWEHAGAGRELAHGVARLERRFVRLPLEHNIAWFDWFAADVTPDWRVLALAEWQLWGGKRTSSLGECLLLPIPDVQVPWNGRI